jgi:hypothetical protein
VSSTLQVRPALAKGQTRRHEGFGFTEGRERAKLARMDLNAVRSWGIAVSAALMAGALAISLQDPPPARAAQDPPASAQAEPGEAAPVAFIVRFRGAGPIARAQARAARGDAARAQREVELQLRRQTPFAGLCFDRFTVGGAEIVLRTCDPVPAAERAAVQARWLARLQAMRAVDYVDANAVATPERAPS